MYGKYIKYVLKYIFLSYLEVKNNGPYQAKNDGWSPISYVCGVDVD